jgi:hypothetical protein
MSHKEDWERLQIPASILGSARDRAWRGARKKAGRTRPVLKGAFASALLLVLVLAVHLVKEKPGSVSDRVRFQPFAGIESSRDLTTLALRPEPFPPQVVPQPKPRPQVPLDVAARRVADFVSGSPEPQRVKLELTLAESGVRLIWIFHNEPPGGVE